MVSIDDWKLAASAFIKLDDQEVWVERLLGEPGMEKIRVTLRKGGIVSSSPLILSEKELLELLHQAIHAGVLHDNFSGKLREKFEI
jgi:hypothetical protein